MTEHEVLRAADHLLKWMANEQVNWTPPTIERLEEEFESEFPDATEEDVDRVAKVMLQIIEPRVN